MVCSCILDSGFGDLVKIGGNMKKNERKANIMEYQKASDVVCHTDFFQSDIDPEHTASAVEAYLHRQTHTGHYESWIGLSRAQTSTLLEQ